MDAKQKGLLVLTVAALGFLGYQVFQLVDRDITETPIIAEQQAPMPQTTAIAQAPVVLTPSLAQHTQQPIASATLHSGMSTAALTNSQKTYMAMLKQYELVKMKHQLLDEEAAVASAQNQIAVTNKSTSKITGHNALTTSSVTDDSNIDDSVSLSYIDHQNGQWSATLHSGDSYQSVAIGARLENGYQVIGIDHHGVTLQKAQARELLTFDGITTLPPIIAASTKISTIQKTAGPIEQTHLLAMQLVHDGQVAPAVARHALKVTPALLALQHQAEKPVVFKRPVVKKPTVQLSINDRFAKESEDDMQNKKLSEELQLPSVEINPVLHQAYNVDSYLPQQSEVPKSYHLADAASSDDSRYASEGVDHDAPAPKILTASEKRLLKLPRNYYTIQLIGSYHPDVVNQFVIDNELKKIALQLHIGKHNHPWAIALYGTYSNFQKAEEKLVHLPERMRLNGAWIRKVGDVQRVLRHYS